MDYFGIIISWIAIALCVWRINENHERNAIRALDRMHTGADVNWAVSLREQRGRHALNLVRA